MNRRVTTVGITHRTYLEKRNFVGLPLRKYVHRKVWDVYQVANYAHWKVLGSFDWRLNFTHSAALLGRFYRDVRLLHFMNGVSRSTIPWISTFETLVPRYRDVREADAALLAATSCRKLIATSRCALDLQKAMIRERFPAYASAIEPKLVAIQPSQAALLGSVEERIYVEGGVLTVTLAGTELTRKGLLEVLNAVDAVRSRGGRIELRLVGQVNPLEYPYRVDAAEAERTKARIAASPHVRHHERLPNEDVLRLMRRTDLGLLPSYHDSHGYSVLEFLASGCPVVTTTIRALAEINDPSAGWLIDVPIDEHREVVMRNAAETEDVRHRVQLGLERVFESVLQDPSILASKGSAALRFVRAKHDPEQAARTIEAIYDEAVAS